MKDIFSEIEKAAEKDQQQKQVDLGPVSSMVEKQGMLESDAQPHIYEKLYKIAVDMRASVSDIEELLKKRKKDLFNIRQVQIPEYMTQIGLKSVTSSSGISIDIKNDISTSIKDEEKFFKFLEDNHSSSIIKDVITVTVEDSSHMKEVVEQLDRTDCFYERKRSVHGNTLKKFVKDFREEGKKLPDGDVLSVYDYSYSKINKKKGKK